MGRFFFDLLGGSGPPKVCAILGHGSRALTFTHGFIPRGLVLPVLFPSTDRLPLVSNCGAVLVAPHTQTHCFMLVLSILSLALASFSAFLCFTVQEDVVRASLGCVAVLSILVTLFFAPWALKLSLAAVPFGVERFYRMNQNTPLD